MTNLQPKDTPMTESLNELADRVEAASADEQDKMLRAAFEAIYPTPPSGHTVKTWSDLWIRFDNMLRAEAYESAAMSLVPEGWQVAALEQDWQTKLWRAQLIPSPSPELIAAFDAGRTVGWDTADSSENGRHTVADAALAITAAALRARGSEQP